MGDSIHWDDPDDSSVPALSVEGTDPFAVDGDDEESGSVSFDGGLGDDSFDNAFTEEIENVTASDWDVDADVLWGDDGGFDVDPGTTAFDFPV